MEVYPSLSLRFWVRERKREVKIWLGKKMIQLAV